MQLKRDELVKIVCGIDPLQSPNAILQCFPSLKQIYPKRGVCFTEVDLRWGITADQRLTRKLIANTKRK